MINNLKPVQMRKICVNLVIIAVLFSGCEKQSHKTETAAFSLLSENTFILTIDRIANGPDVQFPGDSLKESDFTATDEDIHYGITFSENGRIITIESTVTDTVSGERANDGEASKRYELDEGLFAGGRFIIWISNGSFEAEYTVYGSGVPIIRSERGKLTSNARPVK
jgi:hypothetical protein